MSAQVTFLHVHTPQQVLEIVKQAQQLTHTETLAEASADAVFAQACALLGARVMLQAMPQPIDLTRVNFPFKAPS